MIHALLIEDSAVSTRYVRQCLSKTEVVIHAVGTVGEGLQWLQTISPDIILLDLVLPNGEGMDLLRRVLDAVGGMVPVVCLTAGRSSVDALAGVRAGAEDYLLKCDATPEELLRVIKMAINRHALRKRVHTKLAMGV